MSRKRQYAEAWVDTHKLDERPLATPPTRTFRAEVSIPHRRVVRLYGAGANSKDHQEEKKPSWIEHRRCPQPNRPADAQHHRQTLAYQHKPSLILVATTTPDVDPPDSLPGQPPERSPEEGIERIDAVDDDRLYSPLQLLQQGEKSTLPEPSTPYNQKKSGIVVPVSQITNPVYIRALFVSRDFFLVPVTSKRILSFRDIK